MSCWFLHLHIALNLSFRLKFFPKKTTDYVSIILDKIIKQRSDLFMKNEPKDLLDALLKIKKQAFLEGEREYHYQCAVK